MMTDIAKPETEVEIDVGRTHVVVPHTGELIPLDDPEACATTLEALRQLESRIADLKRTLSGAVADAAATLGTKTITISGGRKVTVGGGSARRVNPAVLKSAYRDAGMPEERVSEIVRTTVELKVDLRAADQAARANPAYAAALAEATTIEERPWTVSIRA